MLSQRVSLKTNWLDFGVSGIVLAILLVYTYGFFIQMPYLGLEINSSDTTISRVYPNPKNPLLLLPNDQIITIGGIDYQERFKKASEPFYGEFKVGDVVEVVVVRDARKMTVSWVITGPTLAEFIRRLFSYWYLAFIFWGFGLATALLVRPRDDRWRLLVGFDYLMALWIIFGACTEGRIWYSGVLMRSVSWLLVPVSLALHWTFPRRIKKPRPLLKYILFSIGIIFAILEIYQVLPLRAFYVAISISLIGSISLMMYQWLMSPDRRVETRLPFVMILIFIVLAVESNFTNLLSLSPVPAEIILLFAPLLPMSYFYAIYSQNLGGLEIRLNRSISVLGFLAFITLPVLPVLAALNLWLRNTGLLGLITIFYGISTGLLGIYFYPSFQRWFGKTFLAIPDVSENLISSITTYLSRSLDEDNLIQVLKSKVFPSFLIRQAVVIRLFPLNPAFSDINYRTILSLNPQPPIFSQDDLKALVAQAEQQTSKTTPNITGHPVPNWVRLVIPLSLEQQLVGLCLLGSRDPDDYYDPADIRLLQAVMNQATLVLVHIEKTRDLRAFLQEDIQRQEAVKLRSARRLHDQVLGQLTVLGQNIDHSDEESPLVATYQETVQQVREVIAGLRPSALNFGLEMALTDLVDRLSENNLSPAVLELDVHSEQSIAAPRYPPEVELQVYRIVQQACENSLQHASAAHIRVNGIFKPESIVLTIVDDGKGFEVDPVINFETLLEKKHYGLVGMAERAALIHASLVIISAPAAGTEVRLHWQASPMD